LLQSQKYSALHETELLQPSSVVSVTIERTHQKHFNFANIYEIERSLFPRIFNEENIRIAYLDSA